MINRGDLVRVGCSCLNQTLVDCIGLVLYADVNQIQPAIILFKNIPYNFHDTYCLEVLNESRKCSSLVTDK